MKENDIVMVNKAEEKISAKINGKEIAMTFDEFDTLKQLINTIVFDYSGEVSVACVDKNGKIVKF